MPVCSSSASAGRKVLGGEGRADRRRWPGSETRTAGPAWRRRSADCGLPAFGPGGPPTIRHRLLGQIDAPRVSPWRPASGSARPRPSRRGRVRCRRRRRRPRARICFAPVRSTERSFGSSPPCRIAVSAAGLPSTRRGSGRSPSLFCRHRRRRPPRIARPRPSDRSADRSSRGCRCRADRWSPCSEIGPSPTEWPAWTSPHSCFSFERSSESSHRPFAGGFAPCRSASVCAETGARTPPRRLP